MKTNHANLRWALLGLILLAYARLVYDLDAKNLWWDESLSLQRAESALGPLLRNELWMFDGIGAKRTIDQHPFFFFLIQSFFVRTAGISEFSLRYVSVIASTLLVPMLWACSRAFVTRDMMTASGPLWATFLGAISPYYLWYGQEARPYALWAFLTLLSTYLLVKAVMGSTLSASQSGPVPQNNSGPKDEYDRRKSLATQQASSALPDASSRWWNGWLMGYGAAMLMSLTTHYFATFIVPVHAVVLLVWLLRHNWILAVSLTGGGLLAVGLGGWLIAQSLLSRGGGINFSFVSIDVLLMDLLNAFGMGPSANVDKPWVLGLDTLFGLLALLGMLWAVRRIGLIAKGGWLVPALVLVPIAVLLILQSVRPVYMNARHMSLIGGGYLLAAGGGLGLIWGRFRWIGSVLALLLALLLLLGSGRSTVDYFIQEEYAKDDFESLGSYFSHRVLPGDAVLVNPAFSWRHFYYYMPLSELQTAQAEGGPVAVYGVPLAANPEETGPLIAELSQQYRRIWMLKSGTNPFLDPQKSVEAWLKAETDYRLIDHTVFSHSTLRAELYYPQVPVYNEPLETIPNQVDVAFGDLITLIGYDVEPPITPNFHTPLFLYWQIAEKTELRYKYVVRVEESVGNSAADQWQTLVETEREPFEGWISTDLWRPGQTFLEFSDLAPVDGVNVAAGLKSGELRLSIELYHPESLEKLLVTEANGALTTANGPIAHLRLR